MPSQTYLQADWRREAIRANPWVVPATEASAVSVLFVATFTVERAACHGRRSAPRPGQSSQRAVHYRFAIDS